MPDASESAPLFPFAGLSGVQEWPSDYFDFGEGVVLSRTYVHLFSPYLVAFTPAEPGQPHPAPWKTAEGGSAFDVNAQLEVPPSVIVKPFDHLNTIWWFVALLRLKCSGFIVAPVVSNQAFSDIPDSREEPDLRPMESSTNRMAISVSDPDDARSVKKENLQWIRENWRSGSKLLNDGDFRTAFTALNESATAGNPNLALIMLWGALERLFSPARHELRFRISATIAAYLHPPGKERRRKYKAIRDLYDARSKVAHGADHDDLEPLSWTYKLLRRTLIKMIEEEHVPKREELEENLFGIDNQSD